MNGKGSCELTERGKRRFEDRNVYSPDTSDNTSSGELSKRESSSHDNGSDNHSHGADSNRSTT